MGWVPREQGPAKARPRQVWLQDAVLLGTSCLLASELSGSFPKMLQVCWVDLFDTAALSKILWCLVQDNHCRTAQFAQTESSPPNLDGNLKNYGSDGYAP